MCIYIRKYNLSLKLETVRQMIETFCDYSSFIPADFIQISNLEPVTEEHDYHIY